MAKPVDLSYYEPPYARDALQSFHDIRFLPDARPQPPKSWEVWKRNPTIFTEYIMFSLLLTAGVLLIVFSSETEWRDKFGTAVFSGGFVPLASSLTTAVVHAVWLRRPTLNASDVIAGLFVGAGAALNPSADGDWLSYVGTFLLEAGLVYFLYRCFFFVELPSDTVAKLESELSDLNGSVALGLADSYWFNFLKWVATDLAAKTEHGRLVVTDEPPHNDPTAIVQHTLEAPRKFVVLIPRTVHWNAADDGFLVADYLFRRRVQAQYMTNCCLGTYKPLAKMRPQWVSRVNARPVGVRADVLFDVPTTFDTILRNIADDPKYRDRAGRFKERMCDDRLRHEINRFSSRIAWRLRKMNVTNVVIVEVDSANLLEFLPDVVRGLDV